MTPYDVLPDAVVCVDARGTVRLANAACGRVLGRDPALLTGRVAAQVLPLRDSEGRDWWACTDLTGGLATRVRLPEQRLWLPDPDADRNPDAHPDPDAGLGARATSAAPCAGAATAGRAVSVTGSLLRADDRTLSEVWLALRPVRRLDRDLEAPTAPTDRADQERAAAELLSVVAHELRSPLTGIKGFTATLLSRWERFSDAQRRELLATVDADADRLARLITELLDVARIDTGRLALRRQPLDLADVVRREVSARVAAGAAAERLDVRADGPTVVDGDPDKLAQVVANLVDNGLRHGRGTVTVIVSATADTAVLEVTDEGPGIPEAHRAAAFEKFWHAGDGGGTGLGLYVAKGIVDAHGATIAVGDGDGDGDGDSGGARVSVTLPRVAPGEAP